MKKEFILSKIEAVHDGSPYVYVGFVDPNDSKSGEARQQNPFGFLVVIQQFDNEPQVRRLLPATL